MPVDPTNHQVNVCGLTSPKFIPASSRLSKIPLRRGLMWRRRRVNAVKPGIKHLCGTVQLYLSQKHRDCRRTGRHVFRAHGSALLESRTATPVLDVSSPRQTGYLYRGPRWVLRTQAPGVARFIAVQMSAVSRVDEKTMLSSRPLA
jgi:hypothetical protein